MKKIYLLLLLVCLVMLTPTQQTQNTDPYQAYLEAIQTESVAQEERIVQYLQENPQAESHYIGAHGQDVALYDVIDGKPFYVENHNADAAEASGIDKLHTDGGLNLDLDGSGVVIGYWDNASPLAAHLEFTDDSDPANPFQRVVVLEASQNANNHATHTIGTIAAKGDDAGAKGMAPAVFVKAYLRGGNDLNEVGSEVDAASDPIILSYHPYSGAYVVPQNPANGLNTATNAWQLGAYPGPARQWDVLMSTRPFYLHINSAGNNGDEDNNVNGLIADSEYDKLAQFGTTSKNNLVVANASPTLDASGNFVSATIFSTSSQGPTDDLRIKPDIAADGDGVRSTLANGAYGTSNGTSRSGAVVTGAAALLQQYHNDQTASFMWGSTLKGLLLHTAIDDATNVGPDPHFGWGFMDAAAAVDVMETHFDPDDDTALLEQNSLVEGTTDSYSLSFTADANAEVRATLCWTDLPGTAVSGGTFNDPAAVLVNDLDIVISSSGGTNYYPWRLEIDGSNIIATKVGANFKDPIERIDFVSPMADTYTLTVSYVDDLGANGVGAEGDQQDYSLILSGITGLVTLPQDTINNPAPFIIYPNPSTDGSFYVEYGPTATTLSVYGLDGREHHRVELPTDRRKEKISLDGIGPGVYFVRMQTGEKVTVKKWVVR